MVPPNSGDNIDFKCLDTGTWTPIQEMRFEEARTYRWRSMYKNPFEFRFNGMQLPMVITDYGWEGEFMTPFQSGLVTFLIVQSEQRSVETYLFSDERKITETEYQQMITDILTEAVACFQHSGSKLHFDTSGFDRKISIAQWDYIDRSFYRLQHLFRDIQSEPLRRLQMKETWLRREKVKHVTPSLLAWAQRHSGSGMTEQTPIPSMIWTGVLEDSYDVYENQVMLRQLRELQMLLRKYEAHSNAYIQHKAHYYYERISYWIRSQFLQNVSSHVGPIVISQAFRKHPIYRNWFAWFQQLYQFNDYTLGTKHSIPLKDTYHLYEMWVFMQMVKILRESGSLLSAEALFTLDQDGLVLNLSEKKEHRIQLIGGGTLAYQRWFTKATLEFITYTHGMKPDIVLELKGKLYIFDPKYRLDHNLPMALGEMHKYRDGIVRKSDRSRAVEEVFIITPAPGKEYVHFFEDAYRQLHHMGAYCLKPGEAINELKDVILLKVAESNI